ncbi:adenine deaminase [Pseudooceanicola algae]|uniref:adenine deaminase n=1 Tax=Pseudooceanicola algae TaxID=1537215 RepID=A0A418SEG2_9RHOB|nr:adenine deaminase C-terminal domain-containing protein [Pseudooceanicola algae]QPM89753.1 Adenine deaminase [Pseudooceanicola algae]
MTLPPETVADTDLDPVAEAAIRQALLQVALGHAPADRILRPGRLLDTGTGLWRDVQEIVISGARIAYTGPAGSWPGTAPEIVDLPDLAAVPGLGEVHKHIESSHLTPEYEAALVLPRGNTWTCEASHEFSNVDADHTLDFWLAARRAGSPLKIYPLPGSAVPPTAYEHGGGWLGHDAQRDFLKDSRMVAGLDEVMDWPGVSDPANPSHDRLWGMMTATMAARAVVEGHAAGITDLPGINAFAAAGIASDHEMWTAQEAMDKLAAGLFVELRIHSLTEMVQGLLQMGLRDWSRVAFATDDRSATDTLKTGATDHNVRTAIAAGLAPEIAIQCATINPARHMRLEAWQGLIAPGRYADIVLLDDVDSFAIAEVWADGRRVSRGKTYLAEIPQIDWPDWASDTVNVGRTLQAEDFRIPAAPGRETMTAALLRPFHWAPNFLTADLPVQDGAVQRDSARNVTKFAVIDRFSGRGEVSKMFWLGCGPATPETALACSMAHDKHNLWACGSSDAAMALAANTVAEMQGGWALVSGGKVLATIRWEIAGLMSARPAQALDADMQALLKAAETIDWLYEPSYNPRWQPGFPERLAWATLTCSPWTWVLVAPSDHAPEGLVNVTTGATHPVVW